MTRPIRQRHLHVIALPHTTLTERDITCAYSMKVLKFCKMMRAEGCHVTLYGPDESDAECDEHVVITTAEDRERWGFGDGFDTVQTPFEWDWNLDYWVTANSRAIEALRERVHPLDYLCLTTGTQQPIADAISPNYRNPIVVEWAVGYQGTFVDACAWESYAWMHHVYGKFGIENGRVYDQVIPNFFDVADFHDPARWQGAPKADYVMFIGRLISRKGPHIASMIAQRLGLPLVVAGPGLEKWNEGDIKLEGEIDYVGIVGFEERANLMARAKAVIVPTMYIEPFGGVAVEAMLSGTPVVASDWGSFTEIVTPDVGLRFRTLRQGVEAFDRVQRLDPIAIREAAAKRFSLEAVGPRFTSWFNQLDTLWQEGYYA